MKRIFCLISALLLSFPLLLQAGPFMSSGGGVALQDSDGSSGGYSHTLKLSTGDWSVTGGVATLPTGASDNETLINRLIDADHADNNATNSETRTDQSVTPASLAYWSQNALTTRLMAWLAGGTITGLNIGDGNFTVDSSGNVVAKTIASSSADGEHYMQAYNTTTNPACGAGTKGAIATVGSTPALQICDGSSWGALAGAGDFLADGSVPMTDGLVLANGNGDAPTADGEMKYDRTAEKLQIGDGAATKEFVPVGVSSMITKYQYFPAAWMEDNATTPAAAAALISGEEIKARLFADNETTIVLWQVDPEWTAGLKFRVYYSLVADGEADDTATFRLKGCSVGNSDLLTCTAGDPIGVSDEIGTDDKINELMITGWSDTVTITNLAANELARLTFYRGSDDEAGELNVIGIEIKYQAKISAASDY